MNTVSALSVVRKLMIYTQDCIISQYNTLHTVTSPVHRCIQYMQSQMYSTEIQYQSVNLFWACKMKTPGDSFVYEIQLCTSSFMTSAAWLRDHLHFVWLLFICSERTCLQATFLMFFKIAFSVWGQWESDKERNRGCVLYMQVHVHMHFYCGFFFFKWPQTIW